MVKPKDLKVIQICDCCAEENYFTEGVFCTLYTENPKGVVEIFLCGDCKPSQEKIREIAGKKLSQEK